VPSRFVSRSALHTPRPGELLPAFALPSAAGGIVRLWDFKQRQPVLLALPHTAECRSCRAWLANLSRVHSRLEEVRAAVLVLVPEPPDRLGAFQRALDLPFMLLASDAPTTAAYLSPTWGGVALYAADRYGACVGAWHAADADMLPPLDVPLAALSLADQSDCACAIPSWPDE
jgi:peroxiredoxin